MLHRLSELDAKIRRAADTYDWAGIIPDIHGFCATDLSAFYFDIRKDSLYCDRPDATRRRAARTVLDHVHRCLCIWLAPTLVFTADEAWTTRFGEESSVHLQQFPLIPTEWRDDALADKWARLRKIRRDVTAAIEEKRSARLIGSSLQAAVEMSSVEFGRGDLTNLPSDEQWAELAIVSQFSVVPHGSMFFDENVYVNPESGPGDDKPNLRVTVALGQKCARCWRVLPEVGRSPAHPALCLRCEDAVTSGLFCGAPSE
jgi:isoleucyl-tRNA synthetase